MEKDIVVYNKELPSQGNVTAGVKGAPNVDAGKQGKHVHGHNNSKENNSSLDEKTYWPEGENGVELTQEAWMKGTSTGNGIKVWDAGKVVGENGERGVRVHQDSKGNIHGYPVNVGRYLK